MEGERLYQMVGNRGQAVHQTASRVDSNDSDFRRVDNGQIYAPSIQNPQRFFAQRRISLLLILENL